MDWTSDLSQRERSELRLCRLYAEEFDHGTNGHLVKTLVARLADKLDELQAHLQRLSNGS